MNLPLSLRALPDEAMVPWGWVREELGLVEDVDDERQRDLDILSKIATAHIGCVCHAPGASPPERRV